MNAEIVTIGTELLLGEIVDTNSAHMARTIRDIGLDLFFQTTVGDNEERVAEAIRAALQRADVVITTGGLGPTVDDVTRPAVAKATNRPLEFRPDLFEQIAARFSRWGAQMSPNNRQQAYVPAGAIGLENPVGTAPCFIVETDKGTVICLPGVPREMVYMLQEVVIPYLQQKMGAPAVILARVLRTAGIGESQVDTLIHDLERLTNPTVGLAAHAGQTDIRVTAKAASVEEAEEMIEPVAEEIRQRLGTGIYGEGTETVEEVLTALLRASNLRLSLAELGTDKIGTERLLAVPRASQTVGRTVSAPTWKELAEALAIDPVRAANLPLGDRAQYAADQIREADNGNAVGLAILVDRDSEGRPMMGIAVSLSSGKQSSERGYGGPPEHVNIWATTSGFDLLRRWLLR